MLNNILDSVQNFDTITIFRHQFPDMDAIGSQYGLQLALESLYPNKKIYCIGSKCNLHDRLGLHADEVDSEEIKSSCAIILDTSNAARIDDERYSLAKHSIRIDHHVQVETICEKEWIDAKASATCEMLALYFLDHNYQISKKASLLLYLGLTADNIRFTTNNVRCESFEAAKYLFSQGVDVTEVEKINFAISMKDYKYETKVRNHAVQKNKFLYAIMEIEDYESLELDESSAKDKVYVLGGIEDIEMWALFTRMSDRIHYRASLRSKTIEIRDVACQFGGGGHMCASGIKNLTLEQVNEIIDVLSKRG